MMLLEDTQSLLDAGQRLEPLLDRRGQRSAVSNAFFVVGKTRIADQFRPSHRMAQRFEMMGRGGAKHHVSVPRLEHAGGGMKRGEASRALRLQRPPARAERLDRGFVIVEVSVDQSGFQMLADAGVLPMQQRVANRGQRVYARTNVA